MPSLFRFLFIVGAISGLAFAGLYVLATKFEPEQRDVSYRIEDLQVERAPESN